MLEIRNLKKYYQKNSWFSRGKDIKAVNGVSFTLYEGETLGLVGESGCGKTTLGRTIIHLEQSSGGSMIYRGKDITRLNSSELKGLRKEVQVIFQDPFSSLNPRITIGSAILEPMIVHNILSNNAERKSYVLDLLEKVGLKRSTTIVILTNFLADKDSASELPELLH